MTDNRPDIAAAAVLLASDHFRLPAGDCWCSGPAPGEPECLCRMKAHMRARLERIAALPPVVDDSADPSYAVL